MRTIDLRSDTVTQPTEGMRRAIARAVVGDDVYGEDPTVNRLQEMAAELLGMEAGLFVASGTMGNVVAILTHGGRGDEMILGDLSHTFLYEGGAAAGLAGMHSHILRNEADGTMALDAIEDAIRGDNVHFPRTRLICLENTHNRCGGRVLTPAYCDAVGELAHRHGIAVHLDGARLFNAAIALGSAPTVFTRSVDSVMICLSKGLGAPIGSLLCGSRAFIASAKRMRKIVGGGMRQVGILAAAGIYALEHHIDRLADDHENARRLAEGIAAIPGLHPGVDGDDAQPVETNIVYFTVDGAAVGEATLDAAVLSNRLRERGVLANPLGRNLDQMRMVTHLDLSRDDIEAALYALRSSLERT
jgi:threonine aldolase